MTIDWEKIRADFPVTKKHAYFLSAAMSPMSRQVFEALTEEYRKILLDGDIHFDDDLKKCETLTADLAELLNADASDVTFVANTSTAMSLIAQSFLDRVARPFNVVSLDDEFPSSTVPFKHRGVETRAVLSTDGRTTVDSILAAADGDTLAVVASYVQYATGFRLDIEMLGKALKSRNILFIVNATQAFPIYPVDVEAMGIDALACSLHKWGLAGHLGSMFYTSAAFRETFPSPVAGWLSVTGEGGDAVLTASNSPFRLHASAKQYTPGTINLQPLLAFQEALNYLKGIGLENIRRRLAELTDYLIAGLKELGIRIVSPIASPEERSAIVAFTLGKGNASLIETLAGKNVQVSLRRGHIRAAVNVFNDFSDIDRLLDGLKNMPA